MLDLHFWILTWVYTIYIIYKASNLRAYKYLDIHVIDMEYIKKQDAISWAILAAIILVTYIFFSDG